MCNLKPTRTRRWKNIKVLAINAGSTDKSYGTPDARPWDRRSATCPRPAGLAASAKEDTTTRCSLLHAVQSSAMQCLSFANEPETIAIFSDPGIQVLIVTSDSIEGPGDRTNSCGSVRPCPLADVTKSTYSTMSVVFKCSVTA
jgi:hypothetical protein